MQFVAKPTNNWTTTIMEPGAFDLRREGMPHSTTLKTLSGMLPDTATTTAEEWAFQEHTHLATYITERHMKHEFRVVVSTAGKNCASAIVLAPSPHLQTLLSHCRYAGPRDSNMAKAFLTPNTYVTDTDLVCCNIAYVKSITPTEDNRAIKLVLCLNAALLQSAQQRDLARKCIIDSGYDKTKIHDEYKLYMHTNSSRAEERIAKLKTASVLGHVLAKCKKYCLAGWDGGNHFYTDTLSRDDEKRLLREMDNFEHRVVEQSPNFAFEHFYHLHFTNLWLFEQLRLGGWLDAAVNQVKKNTPALAREVDACMQTLHNVMLMRDDMLVDLSKLEFLRGLPLEVF